MAIGFETVSILKEAQPYDGLEQKAARLEQGICDNFKRLGLDFTMNRAGSMFCLFFTGRKVDSYAACMSSDAELFKIYFRGVRGLDAHAGYPQLNTVAYPVGGGISFPGDVTDLTILLPLQFISIEDAYGIQRSPF